MSNGKAFTLAIAGWLFLQMTPAGAQTSDASAAVADNSWRIGTPMPTAREGAFTGAIGGKIYVIGGASNSATLNVNEIYDTTTNSWTTGVPMPTARRVGASAVVDKVLYTIAGESGGTLVNVVEAYDPATDTWSTRAPMPIANDSCYAVIEKGIVFVIGGYDLASGRLRAVESYNPMTNQWAEVAPLNVGKSLAAVGLVGSVIIAAGGLTNADTATADNEAYSAAGHWTTLAPVPTARQGGCFEAAGGTLYFGGGNTGGDDYPLTVLEAYALETNSWTTGLASMPNAVVNPGSASVGDRLYCFGGSDNGEPFQGNVFDYVQIYQP
jgi:N-acetylneuraminic acid mutarotase